MFFKYLFRCAVYIDSFQYIYRNEPLDPFCNIPPSKKIVTQCDEDKTSVVMCNMVKYKNPLGAEYQVVLNLLNVIDI